MLHIDYIGDGEPSADDRTEAAEAFREIERNDGQPTVPALTTGVPLPSAGGVPDRPAGPAGDR